MKTRFALTLSAALLCANALASDSCWTNVEQGVQTITRPATDTSAHDEVVFGGFSRMLAHTPYYGETATTVARGVKDPVDLAFQSMSIDLIQPAAEPYFAQVEASFERAFQPARELAGASAATRAHEHDPLETLFYALLNQQEQRVHVATLESFQN